MKNRSLKEVQFRVEKHYGIEGYVGILKKEISAVGDLIQRYELDKVAFARAKRLAAVPMKPSFSLKNKQELEWSKKHKATKAAHTFARKLSKPQELMRELKCLIRLGSDLAFGGKLVFANGAEKECKASVLLKFHKIEIPLTGMRVPMISQQHPPKHKKNISLIIKEIDRNNIDVLEDFIFKHSVKKVFCLGDTSLEEYGPIAEDFSYSKLKCGKSKKLPKISLVIVSFNQKEFLEECITSVLTQDYDNFEIILVDGGSTDGSKNVINKYKKAFRHVISEPDRGQSHALNKGFALCSGEVFGWLCSDDRLEKSALQTIAFKFAETEADIVSGGCRIIDRNGNTKNIHYSGFVIGKKSPLSFGDCIAFTGAWLKSLYFYQPEVFFSRKIWEKSGGFVREELYYAMDYELFLRFALAGATLYATKEIIGCSRIHDLQKTRAGLPNYLPAVQQILHYYYDVFDRMTQRKRNTARKSQSETSVCLS